VTRAGLATLAVLAACGLAWYWQSQYGPRDPWTDAELATIRSLWIGSLPPLPPDPGNAVADDEAAARFGQRLFFDPRFSANGGIACATCHQPLRRFTDGLAKGQALGSSRRNTRSIVGAAYSPWQYWDGRRDSLWAQALTPLEDPNEHGSRRDLVIAAIAAATAYRKSYESLFGALPDPADADGIDRAFANVGKALAAYERKLLPGRTRFDDYAQALLTGSDEPDAFDDDEIRGLRLFIGTARCTECHNGPLFSNNEFHNTGVISFPGEVPDKGRVQGVREVLADPFNCLGVFSDDPSPDCAELRFVRTGPELIGAFRTPSLRNLGGTAPFMHQGQLPTLAAVLAHYNEAPLAMIGHNEAEPLGLGRRELRQLEAFLETLDAPPATDGSWLEPLAPGLPAEGE